MKTITIKLKGASALLINRFAESREHPPKTQRGGRRDFGTPRRQAELTAYADSNGRLWMPSTWIKGAIQSIASDYKLIGTRKSLKSVSGGCIRAMEEKLYFLENYHIKDIEIDSRPVVIQRARIMRHRARLESWSVQCLFELEDELIDVETLNQMLTDAGRRSGVGDFRPQKGGSFGRFIVTEFQST